MKRFQNPADYLIKMVQAPFLIDERLTSTKLVSKYKTDLAPIIQAQRDRDMDKYEEIDTDF
jgi:hypothetical protein